MVGCFYLKCDKIFIGKPYWRGWVASGSNGRLGLGVDLQADSSQLEHSHARTELVFVTAHLLRPAMSNN